MNSMPPETLNSPCGSDADDESFDERSSSSSSETHSEFGGTPRCTGTNLLIPRGVSSQESSSNPEQFELKDFIYDICLEKKDSKFRRFLLICYPMYTTAATMFRYFLEALEKYCNLTGRKKGMKRVTSFVLDWIELTPKYMLTQKLRNFVLAFTKLYFTQNDTNRVKLALIRKFKSNSTIMSNSGPNSSKVLQLHPSELCSQLTAIEWTWFTSIQSCEFHKNAWQKEEKEVKAPNLVNLANQFNLVSFWVASEVLKAESESVSAAVIILFLETAEKLLSLNNFNTTMEIFAGLNLHAVQRLKRVWALIPGRFRAIFDRIEDLFSPIANYKQYREALLNAVTRNAYPIFPYVAVDLRDVTFGNDGNPNYLDENNTFVNVEKIHILGQSIDHILEFQRHGNFPFAVNPAFFASLSRVELLSEEEMHEKSTTLQPVAQMIAVGPATVDDNRHYTEKPAQQWSTKDVKEWVSQFPDCKDYVNCFQKIDGPTLLNISASELQEVGVKALGARKKLLRHIRALDSESNPDDSNSVDSEEPVSPSSLNTNGRIRSSSKISNSKISSKVSSGTSCYGFLAEDPQTWTSDNVQSWLDLLGFSSEKKMLEGLTGMILINFTKENMAHYKSMKLGRQKKLMKHINYLRKGKMAGLPIALTEPVNWSVQEVGIWLCLINLAQYRPLFEAESINGSVLLDVSKSDLTKMGIQSVGHRKLLERSLRQLQSKYAVKARSFSAPANVSEDNIDNESVCSDDSDSSTSSHSKSDPAYNVKCHFSGKTTALKVNSDITLFRFRKLIKEKLSTTNVTLHHLDETGSLVEIHCDDELRRVMNQWQSHSCPQDIILKPSKARSFSSTVM